METISTYVWFLVRFSGLPKHCARTLIELIKHISPKGWIVVNKGVKQEIANTLEISEAFVNKDINLLYKRNLLTRIAKGCYILNEQYFGDREGIQHAESISITIKGNKIEHTITSELPED